MSTVILYNSKNGTVEKCAKMLAGKLNDSVQLMELHNTNHSIDSFDTIIIGGSIRAGSIQGIVKKFCNNNIDILKNKKLGFFICCLSDDSVKSYIENAFPSYLLEKATATGHFGGEILLEKMNFIEKFIMKVVAKTTESKSNIIEENIKKFAENMNLVS